jgi:activating signal cointegrator 1
MRALTVCQPFAELIASGEKRVENRLWPTRYRGPLAIHAGSSRHWLKEYRGTLPRYMEFGRIIAIVDMVDCVHFTCLDSMYPDLKDHPFASGPWCWVLRDVRRIMSVPCRGALGLWKVPQEVALKAMPVGLFCNPEALDIHAEELAKATRGNHQ